MVSASDGFGFIESSIVKIEIGNHFIWEYFTLLDWFIVMAGIIILALTTRWLIRKWKINQAIRQQRFWEQSA